MAAKQPETLADLLKTLERSTDLRSLARECGLSVRELRRRLAIWRRSLATDPAGGKENAPVAEGQGRGAGKTSEKADAAALELPLAADIPESPLPGTGSGVLEVFTDGASRGNPGPAAIGVVFRQKGGPELAVHCEAIGKTTNNVAEYRAVVAALEHCRRWGIDRVHLFMDSELIVRQLTGVYRVKSPDLRPLYQQVVFLSRELREFRVKHIKRSLNAAADALANRALDKGC